MGAKSAIEWLYDPYLRSAGATWNVFFGCTRVSEECDNCYIVTTMPLRTRRMTFDKPGIGGTTGIMYASPAMMTLPLRLTQPVIIFPESEGDLWHPEVPLDVVATMWAVMALSPRHIYQCTTKRPARQARLLNDPRFASLVFAKVEQVADEHRVRPLDYEWAHSHLAARGPGGAMLPLPNVWLGTTVGSNHSARTRLPYLRRTPAALRWISSEPITDPDLDLTGKIDGIDYVIFGGESGPRYKATSTDRSPGRWLRPLDLDHLATLMAQARAQQAAVYVKQLGTPWSLEAGAAHPKGGDPSEWPAHLRVREYPRQLAERALAFDPDNELALEALS